MAKCLACNQEMKTAKGCIFPYLVDDKNKKYKREKYNLGGRCPDCNCETGQFHHIDCDIEKCPICGDQLLGCSCDFEYSTN